MEATIDQEPKFELLHYEKLSNNIERFYFSYIETLQVTRLISDNREINDLQIYSYDSKNKYLEERIFKTLKTIKEFNSFFTENSDFYIHDCNIKLDDNLILSSHDDGEVSLEISLDSNDIEIIKKIFRQNGLKTNLITEMIKKPNIYLEINKDSEIISEFETFDEYLKKFKL